jgi:3D (Asp-Asp-Asp) domain-containing protein
MRRLAAALTIFAVTAGASMAQAQESKSDPIADLIVSALTGAMPGTADWKLKASLYHAGAKGIRSLDSLGCKVVAMRTAAVDGANVKRHTVLFIKETVGLPMPDGSAHDGYWYASDKGGDIKNGRIDLFTGDGKGSMKALMPLNMATLTVTNAGQFKGCPPG